MGSKHDMVIVCLYIGCKGYEVDVSILKAHSIQSSRARARARVVGL